MKQNKSRKQTLETAQDGLEIILKFVLKRLFPSPQVYTDGQTFAGSLAQWHHNQIFSTWKNPNFRYP